MFTYGSNITVNNSSALSCLAILAIATDEVMSSLRHVYLPQTAVCQIRPLLSPLPWQRYVVRSWELLGVVLTLLATYIA